jgi:hypothetical protein
MAGVATTNPPFASPQPQFHLRGHDMAITKASARDFVSTAQLTGTRDIAAEGGPQPTFDSTKDQALVVGPQLFSFSQGVTAERREMIATSALFASLAADAGADRDNRDAWYNAYSHALTQVGWVLQESTRRSFDREHQGSKVHEAVLEFIGALSVGATALAIIAAALQALKKVDDSKPWITIFDRETASEAFTGFQIGLVSQEAAGAFQVKLTSFALKLDKTRTQILFLDFSTMGLHMDSIASVVTIAEDVLRDVLPDVKQRLKGYIRSYVADVKLPPLPPRT